MSENKKTNQIQPPEEIVLCGASAYNQKFYINENFKNLPDEIKNQLKVMCVLFCADIGGILQLVFDEEGNLEFRTACNEDDLLYDDIGSGLKIKELRQKLLFEEKVFTGVSGTNVIRLLPPLCLSMNEADEFLTRLHRLIK